MAFADYQTLVDKMVRAQGTDVIATTDRDSAIELARKRYSADCERDLVEDVTWLEDGYFGPLPASWAAGAYLKQVEFPIGDQPTRLIEVAIGATPDEQTLVAEDALQAGDIVRVTFAAPHQLNGGDTPADTVPAHHQEAVASYAASLLCGQLAAHFSGERETPTGSDFSNTESRSRNYAARAKEYRAAYYAGIGKADPRLAKADGGAASEATASVSSWSGRPRSNLVHLAP